MILKIFTWFLGALSSKALYLDGTLLKSIYSSISMRVDSQARGPQACPNALPSPGHVICHAGLLIENTLVYAMRKSY